MDADLAVRYLRLMSDSRIGTAKLSRLLQTHGSLEAAVCALRSTGTEHDPDAGVTSAATERTIDSALSWSQEQRRAILLFEQPGYPPLLKEIDSPPPLLFVRGDPEALSLPAVAVVGARRCSEYGRQQALWLASELAAHGLAISSGLAQGIDAAAHRGALAVDGVTVAVMGTGIDRIYPPAHRELAEQIEQSGALISEFALGTPALPGNFPRRNRIVTGLALATLVVEAGLRSGSLISARLASEQNRDVLAVPGAINRATSRGCHQLIRQGAKLVETAEDVLEELPQAVRAASRPNGKSAKPEANGKDTGSDHQLQAPARIVLEQLAGGASLFDTLLERTRLPGSELTALLLELEMAGLVERRGGRYQRLSS